MDDHYHKCDTCGWDDPCEFGADCALREVLYVQCFPCRQQAWRDAYVRHDVSSPNAWYANESYLPNQIPRRCVRDAPTTRETGTITIRKHGGLKEIYMYKLNNTAIKKASRIIADAILEDSQGEHKTFVFEYLDDGVMSDVYLNAMRLDTLRYILQGHNKIRLETEGPAAPEVE